MPEEELTPEELEDFQRINRFNKDPDFARFEQGNQGAKSMARLTQLLEPVSKFAEIIVKEAEGEFVGGIKKELSGELKEAVEEIRGLVNTHNDETDTLLAEKVQDLQAYVKRIREDLDSRQSDNDTKQDKAIARLDGGLKNVEATLARLSRELDERTREIAVSAINILEAMEGEDRLDYSALKNTPSIPMELDSIGVRDMLMALDGEDRLDASAIKNLPTFVQQTAEGIVMRGRPPLQIWDGTTFKARNPQKISFGENLSVTDDGFGGLVVDATAGGGGAVDSVNGATGVVVLDTDDIAEGSTNLYSQWEAATGGINYAGGNVGIGTTSPDYKLEVAGDTAVDGILRLINVGADQKIYFDRTGGNQFSIEHDASRIYFYNRTTSGFPLVILNDGNVGVGTASPAVKFAVSGTQMGLYSTANANIIIDRGGTNRLGSMTYSTAGVAGWYTGMPDSDVRGDGTEYFIGTSNSDPKLWIETNGNVGINNDNPQGRLTVGGLQAGNAGLEIIPGSGIVIQSYNRTSSAYASINFDGSTIGFRPNGSGGFRIQSGELVPVTTDTVAIGSTTLMWSDIYLASGAVINFNNGNATLTHSSALLTSSVDIVVPDESYGAGWNGSLEVPTKNAVYDKISTLAAADISDFSTAADARITAAAGVSIASLSGGKIPTSQLPAIAIVDVSVVANEAAQLALTAEEGDVAVRSDENKSYIHNGGTAGTMADWQELLTPTGAVLSVNGQTGTVVLTTTEVAEGSNLYFTDERAQDAVGGILVDSSEIDFTYDDGTPSITATIVAGSIDETKLDASVNASLDLADSAVQNLGDLGITATATELNYVDGVTSAIQTQLDGKQPTITVLDETDGGTGNDTYTTGDMLYASGADTLAKRGIGSEGDVLTVSSGVPTWAAPTSSVGAMFGPASDGDVDMDGTNTFASFASKSSNTYTLTRNVYADTLTIGSGVTLLTDGWIIYARTITGSGTIRHCVPNAASGQTGGAAATNSGPLKNYAGTNGGAAGDDGVAGGNSTAQVACIGTIGAQGGTGGSNNGGPGGAGGTPGAVTAAVTKVGLSAFNTAHMLDFNASFAFVRYTHGSGSTGGGGANSTGGNGGSAGGGAGASGGMVAIFAGTMTGTFTINVSGANGAGSAAVAGGASGGGGAGGNGGVIVLVTGDKTGWSGTTTLTGGTGGTPGSATLQGAAGANGATGTLYDIDITQLI